MAAFAKSWRRESLAGFSQAACRSKPNPAGAPSGMQSKAPGLPSAAHASKILLGLCLLSSKISCRHQSAGCPYPRSPKMVGMADHPHTITELFQVLRPSTPGSGFVDLLLMRELTTGERGATDVLDGHSRYLTRPARTPRHYCAE